MSLAILGNAILGQAVLGRGAIRIETGSRITLVVEPAEDATGTVEITTEVTGIVEKG